MLIFSNFQLKNFLVHNTV